VPRKERAGRAETRDTMLPSSAGLVRGLLFQSEHGDMFPDTSGYNPQDRTLPIFTYTFLDSELDIATCYELDDRGVVVRVPVWSRFFFSTSSRPALGHIQPPIQWVPEAISPGILREGHEANHSPSTSVEVNKI
jgi:hypothetical protein